MPPEQVVWSGVSEHVGEFRGPAKTQLSHSPHPAQRPANMSPDCRTGNKLVSLYGASQDPKWDAGRRQQVDRQFPCFGGSGSLLLWRVYSFAQAITVLSLLPGPYTLFGSQAEANLLRTTLEVS